MADQRRLPVAEVNLFKVGLAALVAFMVMWAAFVVPNSENGGEEASAAGGPPAAAAAAAAGQCRPIGSPAVPVEVPPAAAAAVPAGAVKQTIPIVGQFMVTSNFGPRWGTSHNGLDLATSKNEPTLAFLAGEVVTAEMNPSAGNWVRIDHGGGVMTVYMHHSQLTVSKGDHVAAGQQIGVQGNTGDSRGPHLHFEVHVNDVPVDPRPYLANLGLTIPPEGDSGQGPAAPGAASPAGAAPAPAMIVLPECKPEPAAAPAGGPIPKDLNVAAVPEWALPWIVKAGAICPEIPSTIVAAQIDQESKWNPKAVNPNSGASGLSQFMPDTFAAEGQDDDGNGTASPFDVGDAVMAQGRYDCKMVTFARDNKVPGDILDLALAGYNAGPHRLTEFNGVPPYRETLDYIPLIKGMATTKYSTTK